MLVRATTGVEAHTHEYIATAHEDQKFGFSIAGGTAAEALLACHAHPWLELAGIHSHIGSQIFDAEAFEVAARRTLRLHAEFAAQTGVVPDELDLGGGFGIAYTSADSPATPAELARALREIIDHECAALDLAVPQLSIEPGRAISGPSALALYRVGTVKRVQLDGGASRLYVAVDGGMSDNIRTALYAAEYSATLASRRSSAPPALARVVGKHCEGGDILVRDEFLPADIEPGDLIAVPASGAYSRSMASNYNHVPRPPVVSVRDGQDQHPDPARDDRRPPRPGHGLSADLPALVARIVNNMVPGPTFAVRFSGRSIVATTALSPITPSRTRPQSADQGLP